MAYNNIIGREEEIKSLERFLKSSKSEFVAIYGSRSVGKSNLVGRSAKLWTICTNLVLRGNIHDTAKSVLRQCTS